MYRWQIISVTEIDCLQLLPSEIENVFRYGKNYLDPNTWIVDDDKVKSRVGVLITNFEDKKEKSLLVLLQLSVFLSSLSSLTILHLGG